MIEIISLIITIVLGLPSLIIFLKQKKTQVIYLENKQINVQEDLLKNFNDLSIKYKGQEINANLIFIRGYIICDGDKDITSNDNYIEIISPDNTKWVDFKIISKSKGLTESSSFEENTAKIKFDLFKSQENYEFEGIIEKNISTKKEDIKLNFFHRIPNINEIETLKVDQLRSLNSGLLISTLSLFFGLFILWTEYEIRRYDLLAYDSKTKKEIENSDITLSKDFHDITDSLKKETNGILLIFEPSMNYDISYDEYDYDKLETKKIKHTIFFKKESSIESIIFIIIALMMLLISAFLYFFCFYLLTKKKYLKYVSEK